MIDKGFVIVNINWEQYLLPIAKVQNFIEVMSLVKPLNKIFSEDGGSYHYECAEHKTAFSIINCDAEIKANKEKE